VQSDSDATQKSENSDNFSPGLLKLANDSRLIKGLLIILVLDALGALDAGLAAAEVYVDG